MPSESTIHWNHRFDDAMTKGRAEGRGVLLDFSAAPM